jgi:hypothetical protein
MPGKVLTAGLTAAGEDRVQDLERNRLASYQDLTPIKTLVGEEDPEVDEAIRQQLRSLGYIK